MASDLTNKELLIFDKKSHPTMKIAEAVRMSIGIPLVFEAYKFGERLVVDGGILSNFPFWIFSYSEKPTIHDILTRQHVKRGQPPDLTIGFQLVSEKDTIVPTSPKSFIGYLYALMGTMMDAHDKRYTNDDVIHVDTGTISATKFDLSADEKKFLFNNGYVAACEFVRYRNVDLTRKDWLEDVKIERKTGDHKASDEDEAGA